MYKALCRKEEGREKGNKNWTVAYFIAISRPHTYMWVYAMCTHKNGESITRET